MLDEVKNIKEENTEIDAQNEVVSNCEGVETQQDYNDCSIDELISLMKKFCKKELVETHRKDIEEIRALFYKKQKNEFDEAYSEYLKLHGTKEGFVYTSKEVDFKEVYGKVKDLRAVLAKEQQEQYATNLQIKLQIIEKIEKLTQSEETMNKTFVEFRKLQEEWKNSGEIASVDKKSIWEKYNLQVAKFYDYVKIDKELRDLDLKKNYTMKLALCEEAEKLTKETLVIKAFNALQKLHDQWREIGPVKEEFKEELWNRFKEATTKINIAHQNYFIEIKEKENLNLEKKTLLCEKVEAIKVNQELTHKQWNELTKQVLEIQQEWKTIGYAPQKHNSSIYERFTKACNSFFEARKRFFDIVKSVETENKKKKLELCEKAESLQNSTDWKETTAVFIQLQKDWKKIGQVAYKDSNILWNRFSSACNAFFNAKSESENQFEKKLEENVSLKEDIITKISEISTDVKEDALKILKDFQEQWFSIQVSAKFKADLQKRFSEAVQSVLKKLNIEKTEAEDLSYKVKISAMLLEKDGEDKIKQETKRLKSRLTVLQTEIKSLENNIGFFNTKSSNVSKLVASVEQNIEKNKKELEKLEQKLKLISSLGKDK